MKTRMVKRNSDRTPRVVYGTGEDPIKANIEFTPNLFVGKEIDYSKTTRQRKWHAKYRTPVISNSATGQTRRFFYILWFLKERDIGYKYYVGADRTWQEVIKDKVGNCCDLVTLVDTLASNTGMASQCGTHIGTRWFVKEKIYQNGVSYNHVFNMLSVNGKKLMLDPTNYVLTGNILPLGRWAGTLQNPVYKHYNKKEIYGDKRNPVKVYKSTETPCELPVA